MNTIVIESPNQALAAGAWAHLNIKRKWSLDLLNPFANVPTYAFKFADARDATLFALKWS